MPSPDASPFLTEENARRWWPTAGCAQYNIAFNNLAYADGLFDVFQIDAPSALQDAISRRKAEFLAGRYCAKHALQQLGRSGPVGIGRHRSPAWPSGVIGSISHCGDLACALASPSPKLWGLGVDLEERIGEEAVDGLAQTILTEDEQRWLALPGASPADTLTRIFSAKESFFKAAHACVGDYFEFTAISAEYFDTQAGVIGFVVNVPLSARLQPGTRAKAWLRDIRPDVVASCVALGTTMCMPL